MDQSYFGKQLRILEASIDSPEGREALLSKTLPGRRGGAEVLLTRYVQAQTESEKRWVKLMLVGAIGQMLDKQMTVDEFYLALMDESKE